MCFLQSVQLAANIFGMKWPIMKQSRKQILLIIMNRSLTPIEFSSAHILTMNLDSFVSVSNKSITITIKQLIINKQIY